MPPALKWFLPDVAAEPPDLDGPERPGDGGPVLPRRLAVLGRHVAAHALLVPVRAPARPAKVEGAIRHGSPEARTG